MIENALPEPPESAEDWTITFTATTHQSAIVLDSNFGLLLELRHWETPAIAILTYCCGFAPFPIPEGVACTACGKEVGFPSEWLRFNAGNLPWAIPKILSSLGMPDHAHDKALVRLDSSIKELMLFAAKLQPETYKNILATHSGALLKDPVRMID